MTLTILEVLYIFLIAFTAIVGTLLTLVLMRLIRILGVAQELVGYYEKIKQALSVYAKIPDIVKETIKEKFGDKK